MEFFVDAQMKRFNLLTKEIDITYHDAALKLGMSDSAMVILYTVCSYGGECLLSDMTSGVSKQTINSALRKLEADGVVRSEVFEGRKKKVYLTEKDGGSPRIRYIVSSKLKMRFLHHGLMKKKEFILS